jgi:cell division protein FtsW (lipid II flippase)
VGVSYVSAVDRDVRRAAGSARRIDEQHLVLVATALVAVITIGLAYSGRMQAIAAQGVLQGARAPVNLNAVDQAAPLERAYERVFERPEERQRAAEATLAFIRAARAQGAELPNVGDLVRARVPGLTSANLPAAKPALVVRTAERFANQTALWGGVYLASFWLLALFWWVRRIRGDCVLLAAVHFLTAVGFAILLTRPDPLRDTLLFVRYAQTIVLGIVVWGAVSALDFRKAAFLTLSYIPLAGALLLCAVLVLFGSGPGSGGVKVNLGPVQPIEAIRLLLALFLAGYFSRRWELLRQINAPSIRDYAMPRWLRVPQLEYVLPVLVSVATALLFFFIQKDLGPALLLSCVFLAMYAVARNRMGMALAGLAILLAGFYAGYALNVSSTLTARVEMFWSPWDNRVRGGDQIAHAAWALSTGALTGTGLGLGDTRYLPAGHTDLVLAGIGEELGFVGLLVVALVYAVIAARGLRTALHSPNDYGFFLAMGVTLFLTIPVLVMAAGLLGVFPLTGVVTPFLSYGGSAMVANFAALGVLNAIRNEGTREARMEPFRTPVRYLGTALAGIAVALLVALLQVQVLSADDTVVRPHLGLHADGVRRFQYNPRVLDVAAAIQRGTVFDRSGLVLATGDAALARQARDRYARFGVTTDRSCSDSVERCYPLGGAAFHVLGDARTHANWSASNTSYVERDFEPRLRGFDDHTTLVQSSDHAGGSVPTLRRDYRELVPLLRHRLEPEHPSVKAIVGKSRDVKLTIDAPLQARVAAILEKYAAKSAKRHAAAIVVDVDTGDLLAVASYPFPRASDSQPAAAGDEPHDEWLDRARYGLYPPGSTFKIVTAAAALRREPAANQTFQCRLLPEGRIGARIPGWGPVRDDVLDTHAHGNVTMHDGLVHSCNAYYAQLAVRVGEKEMIETATRFGIDLTPSGSEERVRATLPHAGYGQGDVVASPLRMARVVATIANGGKAREPRIDVAAPLGPTEPVLPPAAAARLAQYLRDAVTIGTGRSLSGHPWRIAGKTGTAEVAGGRSHSWFVGFAPAGAAKRRIAFAVVIENAGYGGLAAAPVAGEIVTAAADVGLLR